MKKGIIFIGPDKSGKSSKAAHLANSDQFSEIIWTTAKSKSSLQDAFRFQNCTKDTDLIIIDELSANHDLEFFFNAISGSGIEVNKRGQDSFCIKPNILIICDSYVTMDSLPKGRSFSARFDVYEFPYEGEIQFNDLETFPKSKIIITSNNPGDEPTITDLRP